MADDTDLDTTHVVTVFLRHDAEVLLLRRSDAVGSYAGRWGAVAGHAEGDPDTAARKEIREETGLDPDADATLVRRGDPFDVVDADRGTRWVVHPYLFDCATRAVEPNYETTAAEWVPPTEILRRETVPDLWTSYDRVRPTVETVASDREHGSAHLSLRALEVLRDEAALAVERGGGDEDDSGADRDEGEGDDDTGDADGDVVDGADDREDWSALAATARALRDARPSMPVVANRVNRAMHAATEGTTAGASAGGHTASAVEAAAVTTIKRTLDVDDRAAARVAERLPERVATLSRSGTVLTALERADPAFVLVAESRPGREGVATAQALAGRTDADVTLTTDAAFAERLVAADVGALLVGADAILPDGRVVNKVGTRAAATVATREGLDCYVAAASDKVATGDAVDAEERDSTEVYDGDADVGVANPTFGVTPADRFDAVVTEDGVVDADGVRAVADRHRERAAWDA